MIIRRVIDLIDINKYADWCDRTDIVLVHGHVVHLVAHLMLSKYFADSKYGCMTTISNAAIMMIVMYSSKQNQEKEASASERMRNLASTKIMKWKALHRYFEQQENEKNEKRHLSLYPIV